MSATSNNIPSVVNAVSAGAEAASPGSDLPMLVVGTRLHLGQASTPPSDLPAKLSKYAEFCASLRDNNRRQVVGVVAVDATPKLEGYDLVQAVQESCDKIMKEMATTAITETAAEVITTTTSTSSTDQQQQQSSSLKSKVPPLLHVLPVSPWGTFVPALNALVGFARQELEADVILFCSAETSAPKESIEILLHHLNMGGRAAANAGDNDGEQEDTLVVGAVLSGHDYRGPSASSSEITEEQQTPQVVDMSGVTTPWNTLALWNLRKLALTGFHLVSDGLLTDSATAPSFGVEEVATICILQKLLSAEKAKAKLVPLPGAEWKQDFGGDEKRKKWHEDKMKTKFIRADRQLALLGGLTGKVYHY